MRAGFFLAGFVLWLGSIDSMAQTTHHIDWGMSTGASANITIEVGDTIDWINIDASLHNVTSTDPAAPAGFGSGTMQMHDTYLFTFTDPVTFGYVCSFHPGVMNCTITVLPLCNPPTTLNLNEATVTEALVSWTASATESEGYSWVLMNSDDDPEIESPVAQGTVATGVTQVEMTGLTPETDYDFYVRALCDKSAESDLAGPLAVATGTMTIFEDRFEGSAAVRGSH